MSAVGLLSALLAPTAAGGLDLDAVLAAHETTAAQTQYLRCRYTKTDEFPPPGRPRVITGELTRGPGVLYVTAKGGGFESLMLARPGRFETYTSYIGPVGGKRVSNCIITPTLKIRPDADPLRDVILEPDLEAMISGRGGIREAIKHYCKQEIVDEKTEVRIPWQRSDGNLRLSKRHGFLAIGSDSVKRINGRSHRTVMAVTAFARGPQGGSLPTAGTLNVFEDGQLIMSHTTKLSDIDTTPFDEAALKLRYPRRTEVTDMIRGVEYTADEDGRPVGEAKPFVPIVVGASADSKESRLPSAAEPPRDGWWIAPAGCSILLVAAGVWLYARRAARRSA